MADIEFLVNEPDVGFHTDTAGVDGLVEGHFAPVVVVRMAGDGSDVGGEVGGPV